MVEQLPIYVQISGDYDFVLNRVFLPTLPSEFNQEKEVFIITLPNHKKTNLAGHTENSEYKELMRKRIEIYRDIVKKNQGKKILFLDCDVIFMRNFKQEILDILEDHDMCMQSPGYNAGIWGVKCTEKTIQFFEEFEAKISIIPEGERPDGYPQFELVELLEKWEKDREMQVCHLGEEFGYLCRNTRIYHAVNGGDSGLAKIATLALAWECWAGLNGIEDWRKTNDCNSITMLFMDWLTNKMGHTFGNFANPHPLLYVKSQASFKEREKIVAEKRRNIAFHNFVSQACLIEMKHRVKSGTAQKQISEYEVTTPEEIINIINEHGQIWYLYGDNSAQRYYTACLTPNVIGRFFTPEYREIKNELDNSSK
jgi:hypothetical protein